MYDITDLDLEQPTWEDCAAEGCVNQAEPHGYCKAHYFSCVSPYRGLVRVMDVKRK